MEKHEAKRLADVIMQALLDSNVLGDDPLESRIEEIIAEALERDAS